MLTFAWAPCFDIKHNTQVVVAAVVAGKYTSRVVGQNFSQSRRSCFT
jgi:hypothetical protein